MSYLSRLGQSRHLLNLSRNVTYVADRELFIVFINKKFLATLGLNEDQLEIQKLAKNFAKNELYPKRDHFDTEVRLYLE